MLTLKNDLEVVRETDIGANSQPGGGCGLTSTASRKGSAWNAHLMYLHMLCKYVWDASEVTDCVVIGQEKSGCRMCRNLNAAIC